VNQLVLVEKRFIVRNEEETKHHLRVEIGELLHMLVKQNPDLKNWAISVQDCVYGMLEGEVKDRCTAVNREHIGDETKHAIWRIVEKILFTTRCKVIASQEVDEKIAKFKIIIYDLETIILMVTSVTLFLSFYLPAPMAIGISVVGILYSVLAAMLKLRRSPQFLEPLKNRAVRERTLDCLNGNMPEILSEIREIKESLNRRLSN
jgi:hypothetical protein